MLHESVHEFDEIDRVTVIHPSGWVLDRITGEDGNIRYALGSPLGDQVAELTVEQITERLAIRREFVRQIGEFLCDQQLRDLFGTPKIPSILTELFQSLAAKEGDE